MELLWEILSMIDWIMIKLYQTLVKPLFAWWFYGLNHKHLILCTPSASWLPFSDSKVHVPSGYLRYLWKPWRPWAMDSFYETWWLPGDSRIRSWDATVHHEDLVVQHMAQRRGTEDLREEVRHLLLVLHLTAGTSKKNGTDDGFHQWMDMKFHGSMDWFKVFLLFSGNLKLGVLPPTPRHGWVYAIDIMEIRAKNKC